jgi:curved DNA-binding protein CbpA
VDLNFYDVLEIPREASEQHVERAYRIARSTYQPASPATYSVFDDADNADILRRIEEAYSILSDARLRREYDARLRRETTPERRPRAVLPPLQPPAVPEPVAGDDPGALQESSAPLESSALSEPSAGELEVDARAAAGTPAPPPYIEDEGQPPSAEHGARPSAAEYPLPWSGPPSEGDEPDDEPEPELSAPASASAPEPAASADEPDSEPALPEPQSVSAAPAPLEEVATLEEGVYDGRALRATRQHLGLELDEIAELTKIGERYLRLIEANRFADLPAPVYLRGFLREFAKALRLEPGLVVESYMEQYEESRGRA